MTCTDLGRSVSVSCWTRVLSNNLINNRYTFWGDHVLVSVFCYIAKIDKSVEFPTTKLVELAADVAQVLDRYRLSGDLHHAQRHMTGAVALNRESCRLCCLLATGHCVSFVLAAVPVLLFGVLVGVEESYECRMKTLHTCCRFRKSRFFPSSWFNQPCYSFPAVTDTPKRVALKI